MLRQVAEVLRATAREIDRVGRYGGEEFLVLLPGANLDDARHYAERARAAIAARDFAYDGGALRRTMSAGVAAWPHPDVRHQEALVKLADDALYAAKAGGRNRVVAYGDPVPAGVLGPVQRHVGLVEQLGERARGAAGADRAGGDGDR